MKKIIKTKIITKINIKNIWNVFMVNKKIKNINIKKIRKI